MYSQVIFLALFGAVLVNAATVATTTKERPSKPGLPGPCPEFPGVANFDKKRVEGTWYAIEKTPKDGVVPSCVRAVVSPNAEGALTLALSYNKAGDTKRHTKSATVVMGAKSGTYTLNIQHKPDDTTHSDHSDEDVQKLITILDTDYDNYSFEVVCKSKANEHKLGGVLWSRQPTLSTENIAKAKQLFQDKNADVEMATVSHSNCKYD